MTLLADLAIRPSLILLAGLLLGRALARRSAAMRHCILAATIAAAAVVVPLSLTLPGWEVRMPHVLRAPDQPAVQPAAHGPPAIGGATVVAPTPPISRPATAAALVVLAWAAGFAVVAAGLLTSVVRLIRITSRAGRVRDTRWAAALARAAAGYGLTREVVILQTGAPDLLATWGLFQPRVLLPAHAAAWSDDRLHVVLCHELAHISRCDWVVQIAAEALRALFWFNPLMWIACTRLRHESELACDDAVLDRGVGARTYAEHLLELARSCRGSGSAWVHASPMARPSTLERRIAVMLNPGLDRSSLSRRGAIAAAVLVLAVTLPAAAIRAAQNPPDTLSGSVYDATGGVLPEVALVLEDAAQTRWQATTDSAGRFQFPQVAPGHYVLAVSLAGFRPLRHEFDLQSPRDWDRAVTLQVGTVRESITVTTRRTAAPPRPTQPQAAQPIRIGGNVRAPRKTVDVRPIYPASMRDAGREGVVPIEAVIGRDGTVTSVRVLSAQVHPDFAVAAVDAVRQWQFTPTLLNGAAVDVVMTVSVQFQLSDQN